MGKKLKMNPFYHKTKEHTEVPHLSSVKHVDRREKKTYLQNSRRKRMEKKGKMTSKVAEVPQPLQ